MKKVLIVTRPIAPPWDEASKNLAYNLALNLKRYRPSLLTNGRLPDLPSSVDQLAVYKGSYLNLFQKLRLLKASRRQRDFDIIHFMMTPTKLNSRLFKRLFRHKPAKTIQTIATLRQDLFSNKEIKAMLFADQLVTYSDYAKQKLAALGFKNVRRIYPGIDLERFQPSARNQVMAKSLGLKAKDFVVSYPGEYSRLGAIDDLVKLLPELLRSVPAAKLVLACRVKNQADQTKKRQTAEQLRSAGLSGQVVMTDTINDMPALYNLSDVVVFPVRDMHGKFDIPLAPVEAMACAKPVILSDLPTLSEFGRGSGSIIIRPGDIDSLRQRLEELAADSQLRQRLGIAGRRYAVKNFDIEAIAQTYEKLYDELTNDQ